MPVYVDDADRANAQTVGAASTTLFSIPLVDDSVYQFHLIVIADSQTNAQTLVVEEKYHVERQAGVSTLVQTTTIQASIDGGVMTVVTSVDDAGDTFDVVVTGEALLTVEWAGWIRWKRLT